VLEPSSRRAAALRTVICHHALLLACGLAAPYLASAPAADQDPMITVLTGGGPSDKVYEQWDAIEVALEGPTDGNPFVDVDFSATFTAPGSDDATAIKAPGFYDGDGLYCVRFSPPQAGDYEFTTHSNVAALEGKSGKFSVAAATGDNHGPVQVAHTYHFAYADGTPYKQVGTTCYAWTSQPEALQEQTLKTLADAPFNKLRMCVFPKRYNWNQNEPDRYAFEGAAPNKWDFSQFNPEFFQAFEQRILQLRDMGIEADVILLHPYDEGHWGFDRMPDDADDRYLGYIVARLAAIRNVWWSMANEYDFMTEKQESDWDRMIQVVHDADPYHRLLSIHNGTRIYDHNNPLLTHASIQNGSAVEDAGRAVLYRDVYRKPVVFDEVKYEGDIPSRWGQLSPEEMVYRFWQGTVAGTYVGHGETYLSSDDVLWWAKGGVLKGQSPARLAFLRKVLNESPAEGIEPIDKWQHAEYGGQRGKYYLVYLGKQTPTQWKFRLPDKEMKDGLRYRVEVLDTWNMTVEPVDGEVIVKREDDYFMAADDGRSIKLPGRPYMALRITRVEE
jgi:hypothetical protein